MPGRLGTEEEGGSRGATAVLAVLLLLPLLAFTALAIDISNRNETRQQLWDTLDASALAGASVLPDATAATNEALGYAAANMPGVTPTLEFWCLVGATAAGQPKVDHIPSTCNPGPAPYNAGRYPGLTCNGDTCAIPCDPLLGAACNTISVTAQEDVDYFFAPVVGFNQGSTGVLTTAACKGSCGADTVGPADIAMVLDRTSSMSSSDVDALKVASRAFLENLSPTLHHVALGTLGRTDPFAAPCISEASSSGSSGPWVPVTLRNDYDVTDNNPPDSPADLNLASNLVQAIDCLPRSSTGTNLGDPMNAAALHLTTAGRTDVPKGILFMTDGEANQPVGDPCSHAKLQAANAVAAGITVITVAYRLEGVYCGSELATDVLAQMASDPVAGPATADDGGDGPGGLPGGCANAASVTSENADGDHFLCAPNASQLSSAFVAASGALTGDFADKVKLVRPPGT